MCLQLSEQATENAWGSPHATASTTNTWKPWYAAFNKKCFWTTSLDIGAFTIIHNYSCSYSTLAIPVTTRHKIVAMYSCMSLDLPLTAFQLEASWLKSLAVRLNLWFVSSSLFHISDAFRTPSSECNALPSKQCSRPPCSLSAGAFGWSRHKFNMQITLYDGRNSERIHFIQTYLLQLTFNKYQKVCAKNTSLLVYEPTLINSLQLQRV